MPCVENLCCAERFHRDSFRVETTEREWREGGKKKERLKEGKKSKEETERGREKKSTAWRNAAFQHRREQIAYTTRRVHALRIRSGRRSRHANEKGRTNEQKSSSLAGRERVKPPRISALISRVFPNNAHAKSNDSHHPPRGEECSV